MVESIPLRSDEPDLKVHTPLPLNESDFRIHAQLSPESESEDESGEHTYVLKGLYAISAPLPHGFYKILTYRKRPPSCQHLAETLACGSQRCLPHFPSQSVTLACN